eukprot:614168-Rhodomonas_salina.2
MNSFQYGTFSSKGVGWYGWAATKVGHAAPPSTMTPTQAGSSIHSAQYQQFLRTVGGLVPAYATPW